MNEQSTPITNASTEVPRKTGIEGLFDELFGMYGKQFADKWEGVDPVTVKRSWIQGLRGYTPAEIQAGLSACYSSKFAPNLPDFLERCRPQTSLSVDALLHVAIECMIARRNNQAENWPNNRTFWAAVGIGSDMTAIPASQLKTRWQAAYECAAARANEPIPPAIKQVKLPAPGKSTLSQQEAEERSKEIGLKLGSKDVAFSQSTAWAYAIASNPKDVPTVSIEKALKAFVSWGIAIPEKLRAHVIANGLQKILPEVV